MIEQVCDLETVQPQEIYNLEICYRGCGEKASFFATMQYPKMHSCRPINGGGAV